MSQEPVLYEVTDGIAVLTLNNPRKQNALSNSLLRALHGLLAEINDDPAVRVVVLRSEGPVFSSGHDLSEMIDGDRDAYAGIFEDCTVVMESIRLLPKPVIAQVQGLATAAGCQLVATLRPGGRIRDRRLCHPGRAHRPVLHHTGGCRVQGGYAQEGHGDAVDRRPHLGAGGPGVRAGQPGGPTGRPGSDRDGNGQED